jgi:hypothetical protein
LCVVLESVHLACDEVQDLDMAAAANPDGISDRIETKVVNLIGEQSGIFGRERFKPGMG